MNAINLRIQPNGSHSAKANIQFPRRVTCLVAASSYQNGQEALSFRRVVAAATNHPSVPPASSRSIRACSSDKVLVKSGCNLSTCDFVENPIERNHRIVGMVELTA